MITFWVGLLILLLALLLLYLGAATLNLLVLACAYFLVRERPAGPDLPENRFAVIVPAHDEELLIGNLCKSLLAVDYPLARFSIHVVADNCSDGTAQVCAAYPVEVLERNDPNNRGKGQALAWALERIALERFDAVFIVDADNYVDGDILRELNRMLNRGERAIQCCNAVGNRADSWFTRILYVARLVDNLLYHEAKVRLGLSSFLMGNGLCFRADLLRERGWTAFSAGEDWEYYAQLVRDGVWIGFAARARVYHQESKSLKQATSQRLRWSSGRFAVARNLGLALAWKGLREGNWRIVDASLPLLFPNYSLLINLTLAGILLSLAVSETLGGVLLMGSFILLAVAQFALFVAGAILAGSLFKTMLAVIYVPLFLIWKAVIDLLCFTGLYHPKGWIRTQRH